MLQSIGSRVRPVAVALVALFLIVGAAFAANGLAGPSSTAPGAGAPATLTLPGLGDDASPEAVETQEPAEPSEAPEATKAPEATEAPEATDAPEATEAPDANEGPDATVGTGEDQSHDGSGEDHGGQSTAAPIDDHSGQG
jgi:hypothetical protein